jgi:hypothetical protein
MSRSISSCETTGTMSFSGVIVVPKISVPPSRTLVASRSTLPGLFPASYDSEPAEKEGSCEGSIGWVVFPCCGTAFD